MSGPLEIRQTSIHSAGQNGAGTSPLEASERIHRGSESLCTQNAVKPPDHNFRHPRRVPGRENAYTPPYEGKTLSPPQRLGPQGTEPVVDVLLDRSRDQQVATGGAA
jgi:hypothetical protein